MAKSTDLKTVDVPAVEIMAEGSWKGDDYDRAALDEMVRAFPLVSGKIDPPVKLGHDGSQQLAQADGYPALGWVARLYRKGGTLLADLRDVPERIARLISAGAYQKVSSEIYFDKDVDGTTYPFVLKAVSLLGGDMPAVKDIRSIGDIEGLYDEQGQLFAYLSHDAGDSAGVRVVEYRDIPQSARDKMPDSDFAGPHQSYPITKPEDVKSAAALVGKADDPDAVKARIIAIAKRKGAAFVAELPDSWKEAKNDETHDPEAEQPEKLVPDKDEDDMIAAFADYMAKLEGRIAGKTGAKRLRALTAVVRDHMKGMMATNAEEDEMDVKELAEALGLPADATPAQVTAKITELRKNAETPPAELSELTKTVIELKRERQVERIAALIDDGVKAGKLLPSEREDLTGWATRDFEAVEKYVEKRPRLAILSGPIGSDEDGNGGTEIQPAPEVDRQMRVGKQVLQEYGTKSIAQLMEERREKIGTTGYAVRRA